MIIFLLTVIAVLLGVIVYELKKGLPRYFDEKCSDYFCALEKRLCQIKRLQYFNLHSKSSEELKRVKEWEEKHDFDYAVMFDGSLIEEKELGKEKKGK